MSRRGEGTTVAESWWALEDEVRATIAAKDETIGRLDAEVAFLREQLDQRSREHAAERERFDVIQRIALTGIEALTSGRGRIALMPQHVHQSSQDATRGSLRTRLVGERVAEGAGDLDSYTAEVALECLRRLDLGRRIGKVPRRGRIFVEARSASLCRRAEECLNIVQSSLKVRAQHDRIDVCVDEQILPLVINGPQTGAVLVDGIAEALCLSAEPVLASLLGAPVPSAAGIHAEILLPILRVIRQAYYKHTRHGDGERDREPHGGWSRSIKRVAGEAPLC